MKKIRKNLVNLVLYSILILSITDFFHFTNHLFACNSHIADTQLVQLHINSNHSTLINDTFPIVESAKCQFCNNIISLFAIILDNENHRNYTILKITNRQYKSFLPLTTKQLYQSRAPPLV